MMARRKNPAVANRVARLREEYMELLREGLGYTVMSPKEVDGWSEYFELNLQEVFMLYAKVELAKTLDIQRWFYMEMCNEWPETNPEAPNDDP